MKLQVGKWYKNKLGHIYGPMELNPGHQNCPTSEYQFRLKNRGICFTEKGKWKHGHTSPGDLIEEVEQPKIDIHYNNLKAASEVLNKLLWEAEEDREKANINLSTDYPVKKK